MDLIYTNAQKVDQGVLSAHAFDLSFGASENDFEITLGANEPVLEFGAFIYIEGTEYGGTVDGRKISSDSEAITYMGRTWHGMLNSKVIQPDSGADYLIVSGEANALLASMIARIGLSGLFTAATEQSGINVSNYKFHRYCKGYDGLRAMLADSGAKLKIKWQDRAVVLSAEPIVDYTKDAADNDMAEITVKQYSRKVNHLICLGKGDLAAREVLHLYVDQAGKIGRTQYYTGIDEYEETYENTSSEDLEADGMKKLKELLNTDKAEIDVAETDSPMYDIGDIVGATELKTGVKVAETVTQKIIKISNGAVSTEYKTGGE